MPLRKALDEIRVLRAEYAEAFNKQDTAALVAMYAPDAILIRGDGTMVTGKDAIQKTFEEGPWGNLSIDSDTVRVFGNTAVDVGTARTSRKGGGEDVGRYLVVLRRGLHAWRINSLASVPETSKANAKDSTSH
ncbi:MAG: YybH family protein [Gemmatimonadales bacterium]